jgi:hypothetical protein
MKYLKLHEIFVCQSHDASLGRATGYELDARGSFPETGNFSLLHRVQTGSGDHPASYPKGTRGYFPWHKTAGA